MPMVGPAKVAGGQWSEVSFPAVRRAHVRGTAGAEASASAREAAALTVQMLRESQQAIRAHTEGKRVAQHLRRVYLCAIQQSGLLRRLQRADCGLDDDPREMLREVACTFGSSEVFAGHIELDIDPDCGRVAYGSFDLYAAFVELTLNAFEAIGSSGSVLLAVRQVSVSADWRPSLGLPPGEHACVTIEDTGSGMSGSLLENAVVDGFSTKPGARGIGLNLALSAVRAAGGGVHIVSAARLGTRVSVYLPIAVN